MCKSRPIFVALLLMTASSQLFSARPLAAQTQSTSAAQSSAPVPELAQLDQLLKECGDLQTNVRLDELERKAGQALALSQALGDKNRMARSLGYLGSANFYKGRLKEALEYHKQAAAIALEAGNKRYYGTALQNAGATLSSMGRYEEALYNLTKTLDIGKELNERLGVWYPLRNIGYLYLQLGDYDRAEPKLQEALSIAREFKNKPLEEASLLSLIELKIRGAQYQAAQEYCDKALEIDAEVKNPGLHYELLANAADVYQGLGDHHKAIAMYKQALEAARGIGHRLDEAIILSSIGVSEQALGQLSEALNSQARAQTVLRETGAYPDVESFIDWRIARVNEALQHDDDALAAFNEAFKAIERIRVAGVPLESSMASINASRKDVFVDAIALLLKHKRKREALEVAERYRARAFLDVLAESRIDLRDELTPQQRQREDAIFNRLSTVQKELLKEGLTEERQQQLRTELSNAENELDVFRLALRRENPRYATLQNPQPLTVDRIRQELLDGDTALVEYLLGEKRSIAWVLTQESLAVAMLPARKEIEREISSYRERLTLKVSALTLSRDLTEYESESQKLYSMLIRPLENSISGSRKLFIVPDGVLAYVPFETLLASHSGLGAPTTRESARKRAVRSWHTKTLLERFAITYAPSASALAAIIARSRRPSASTKSLLAFGDPVYERDVKNPTPVMATASDSVTSSAGGAAFLMNSYAERGFDFTRLPNTRHEVLAISELYARDQSQIYFGAEAREETVKSAKLDQYRIIHFAAHALIDDKVPSRSGIVLSLNEDPTEDGVLQMSEIMRLRLNAELVTLSACSTGLGKLYDGEGIVGLTRAFLYAGADSVVVSLWNVSDAATAELMKTFYRNLNRGKSRDEALRQAKLAMIKSRHREWRHPYFWAPFVLVGSGR